ncbi:hypothetical protein [Sporosarcina beigongshangi]|uniref:hypothetical protein n=1 Tax=Sporosarcina beigongshangi TaxID=2782538 RepID=UPI00193A26F2|nr:hypothetical protein [Sporosarcina beigongshangi]
MTNNEKIINFLNEEGWGLFNSEKAFLEFLVIKYGADKAMNLVHGTDGIGINATSSMFRGFMKPKKMLIAFNESNEKNSINHTGDYKQLLYNAGYKTEFGLLEVENWEEAFRTYEINGRNEKFSMGD